MQAWTVAFLAEADIAPCFVALIVVVVIGGIIWSTIAARKRREELARWAADRGLHYSPEQIRRLDAWINQFECLHQGSNRYAYNIIAGTLNNREVCAFDYHYETYSTDSKGRRQTHHHYFSAVVVDTNLPLQPLLIRPENIFDKLAGLFGYNDIDFESSEFSRKFCVKAADRKWAFDVIHQKTIEFLLAQPVFSLEFKTSCIMAWQSSTFNVNEFEAALGVIEGIVERFPEYLMQQLRGAR